MKNRIKILQKILSFSLFLSILFFQTNKICGQYYDGEEQNRYYITLHTGMFSGTSYPNVFEGYKATGSAPANYYYPRSFVNPTGNFGFGGSFGYQVNGDILRVSGEIELSMITHSEDKETLNEITWSNYQTQTNTSSFTQSKRKNIAALANVIFGLYPFEKVNLGFYISAGIGVGWQSFHSEATANAERKGFNIKTAAGYESKDLGEYASNGDFNRSSFLYLVGLGSELFVSKVISIKFDYKYIGSSYTRENVLVSSGAVNVYRDKVSYEYTFASKISIGVSYYFGTGE